MSVEPRIILSDPWIEICKPSPGLAALSQHWRDEFAGAVDQLMFDAAATSTYTSACTAPQDTQLTAAGIQRTIETMLNELDVDPPPLIHWPRHPGRSTLFGISTHESDLAVSRAPRRVHHRPRWDRSGHYHARIQKKWTKRFGSVDVPCAFWLGSGPAATLIVHPTLMDKLRKELA